MFAICLTLSTPVAVLGVRPGALRRRARARAASSVRPSAHLLVIGVITAPLNFDQRTVTRLFRRLESRSCITRTFFTLVAATYSLERRSVATRGSCRICGCTAQTHAGRRAAPGSQSRPTVPPARPPSGPAPPRTRRCPAAAAPPRRRRPPSPRRGRAAWVSRLRTCRRRRRRWRGWWRHGAASGGVQSLWPGCSC